MLLYRRYAASIGMTLADDLSYSFLQLTELLWSTTKEQKTF